MEPGVSLLGAAFVGAAVTFFAAFFLSLAFGVLGKRNQLYRRLAYEWSVGSVVVGLVMLFLMLLLMGSK